MASFAKLGLNNKVIAVHALDNEKMLNGSGQEDETVGQQILQQIHGWPAQLWIQTSYNTSGNKYFNSDGSEGDQSKAFRGNFAGIGYTWDEDSQVFWPKKPHDSWIKDIINVKWKAPIPYPNILDDNKVPPVWIYSIYWDETSYQSNNTMGWVATKSNDLSDNPIIYKWNGFNWL